MYNPRIQLNHQSLYYGSVTQTQATLCVTNSNISRLSYYPDMMNMTTLLAVLNMSMLRTRFKNTNFRLRPIIIAVLFQAQ